MKSNNSIGTFLGQSPRNVPILLMSIAQSYAYCICLTAAVLGAALPMIFLGVTRALVGFDIRPEVILSSPRPRAAQTAALAAEALDMEVSEEPLLAPGFDATKLSTLLQKNGNRDIMLVGHEPDFSNAVETLTGGVVVMATAGIAAVDVNDVNGLDGELVWLLTPKVVK